MLGVSPRYGGFCLARLGSPPTVPQFLGGRIEHRRTYNFVLYSFSDESKSCKIRLITICCRQSWDWTRWDHTWCGHSPTHLDLLLGSLDRRTHITCGDGGHAVHSSTPVMGALLPSLLLLLSLLPPGNTLTSQITIDVASRWG